MNGEYIHIDESRTSMANANSIRISTQSGGDAFAFDLNQMKKLNELAMLSSN